MTEPTRILETMPRLALPRLILLRVLVAQSAARTNDHCSCHSVKSKAFTRLMFERGFRAAAAHRASDLKLSPPPRHDRESGTGDPRDILMSSVPFKLVKNDARSVPRAPGFRARAQRSSRSIEILPRTSPLRPHDRGDAGRASSRAADGRQRPVPSLSSGRTNGERELVVGGPRVGVGTAPAGRGGRGAARRDGSEASWS